MTDEADLQSANSSSTQPNPAYVVLRILIILKAKRQ